MLELRLLRRPHGPSIQGRGFGTALTGWVRDSCCAGCLLRDGCATRGGYSMGSKSFAVNQLSETAYPSVRVPDNGSHNQLIRTHNMRLETFVIRIAWAF